MTKFSRFPALTLVLLCTALIAVTAVSSAQDDEEIFTLADMLVDISSRPKLLDQVIAGLGNHPTAVGLVTPESKSQLKTMVLNGDKKKLDAFLATWPSPTLKTLNTTVVILDKKKRAESRPTQHRPIQELDIVKREALRIPTNGPPQSPEETGKDLGNGIIYGEVPDSDRGKHYADSKRLADVLNILSLNNSTKPSYFSIVSKNGQNHEVASVKALLSTLEQTSHSIVVKDARYFANFAGLRYKDKDVAVPFWLDTNVKVPNTDRTLLVPAGHSQHELTIRGPKVNAELKFFFGMHGDAKFRPNTNARANWTGERIAHKYTGKDAIRAMSVAGLVRRAYADKKAKNPNLPLNGYHVLGVCNDSNAFIEYAMTGETTMYPLTRDPKFFSGHGLIDQISKKMPIDGRGPRHPDTVDRILATLPANQPEKLAFETLSNDVKAIMAARGPKNKSKQGLKSDGAVGTLKRLPRKADQKPGNTDQKPKNTLQEPK
jgi:hypothetical protein